MKLLPDLSLPVTADINDPQPLILYHGRNCPDGYGAALAAWLFFSGNAEFRGLDHGEIQTVDDLGPLAGRTIYILDFAFGPELLAARPLDAQLMDSPDLFRDATSLALAGPWPALGGFLLLLLLGLLHLLGRRSGNGVILEVTLCTLFCTGFLSLYLWSI